MILPDFVLPTFANRQESETSFDSLSQCLDKAHFKSYPHLVNYQYNSRGYRDQEWPESVHELQNAIWCVGDSFTVGLGSPREHTWPWLLQKISGKRTINVSLNGASNNWIARKTLRILEEIKPCTIVLHWSYVARRELDLDLALNQLWNNFYKSIRDSSWPDCDRQHISQLPKNILDEINIVHGGWDEQKICDSSRLLQSIPCSDKEDITNTLTCIDLVNQSADSTKIIHSFIPEHVPRKFKGVIESQISGEVIPEISRLDLARDGHHYDLKTSCYLVDQIMQRLSWQDPI